MYRLRINYRSVCLAILVASASVHAQSSVSEEIDSRSIEALMLGTWVVEDREFESAGVVTRQIEGTVHITDRNPDGTYTVLVTLSTHFKKRDGRKGPLLECDGKNECVRASATEGVGVYSNGRFTIDYYAENWYDDVFTVSGSTMRGRDRNGPIVLRKSERGPN